MIRSSPNPLLMNILHVIMFFPESPGLGIFLWIEKDLGLSYKMVLKLQKELLKLYVVICGYNEKAQTGWFVGTIKAEVGISDL